MSKEALWTGLMAMISLKCFHGTAGFLDSKKFECMGGMSGIFAFETDFFFQVFMWLGIFDSCQNLDIKRHF